MHFRWPTPPARQPAPSRHGYWYPTADRTVQTESTKDRPVIFRINGVELCPLFWRIRGRCRRVPWTAGAISWLGVRRTSRPRQQPCSELWRSSAQSQSAADRVSFSPHFSSESKQYLQESRNAGASGVNRGGKPQLEESKRSGGILGSCGCGCCGRASRPWPRRYYNDHFGQ
jgi:hypothetical protein